MVLTLPMFPILRSAYPDERLVLFTRSYVAPLVTGLSCIDEVVFVDQESEPLHTLLRRHNVRTIFFPRPRFSEALAALRARVRTRVGSAYRWYSWLFTVRVPDHRSEARFNEAEYNARMISALTHTNYTPHLVSPVELPVEPVFEPPVERPFELPVQRPFLLIHPGSGGSARDWPAERFGAFAARLAKEQGLHVVVTGIEAERAKVDAVLAHVLHATDLCGKCSLADMIALAARARVLAANSTGILHVGAAVGTLVVGFYPRTPAISARRWGPLTDKKVILESNEQDDMLTITVDQAVAATRVALAQHPPAYPQR
jgi:ADP-heptose:LPS heptosyltransferase